VLWTIGTWARVLRGADRPGPVLGEETDDLTHRWTGSTCANADTRFPHDRVRLPQAAVHLSTSRDRCASGWSSRAPPRPWSCLLGPVPQCVRICPGTAHWPDDKP